MQPHSFLNDPGSVKKKRRHAVLQVSKAVVESLSLYKRVSVILAQKCPGVTMLNWLFISALLLRLIPPVTSFSFPSAWLAVT